LGVPLRKGRRWHLIYESNDEGGEAGAWDIELANELIGKTKQLDGVEILTREV
jgi:hypothetical protein